MTNSKQQMLFSDTPSLEEILRNDSYHLLKEDAFKLQSRIQSSDYEGTVTSARCLLETCCKLILDRLAVSYSVSESLTDLHKKVSRSLQLHPDQNASKQLKKMMRGCNDIVNSMGSLRNSHSDSHGKAIGHISLTRSQSELVSYMAFGLVRFLISSFEEQISRKSYLELDPEERELLLDIGRQTHIKFEVTDPDNLLFKPTALEEIAIRLTDTTGLVLTCEDIYKFLSNARKQSKLWPEGKPKY